MVATLITISAFFYILGTYYAFRLTWSTRQTGATVLSFAVLLMTLREFFLLYNTVLLKRATDPGTELISLFISITIALGIIAIFRGHKRQKFDTEKISTLYTAKILQLSSRSALSLGTLAIFGSCVVGYYAFHTSRNAVIKREFENTYHLANHIREQSKSMWQSTPANERIERIERIWENTNKRYKTAYLCVIDAETDLLIHTRNPKYVGVNVGGVKIPDPLPGGPQNIAELLDAKQDWAGQITSSSGEKQLITYTYLDALAGLIAVHVPLPEIQADFRSTSLPWATGLAMIALLLTPLSLGLLFWSYSSSQRVANKALAELSESEERFNLAVRGSSDGLWDWPDLNMEKAWWSPRLYELIGYENGEVEASQNNFYKLLHRDDKRRVKKEVKDHIEKKKPYDIEYRLRTKSGQFRWFRSRGQAVWDEKDQPVRMSGSLQDITHRKETEKALKKRSQQLRALAAHLQTVREEERTAIAREMHDELGQDLTAFKMDLTFLEKQIQSGKKNDSDHLSSINDLKIFIDKTVHKVRTLIRYLRPEVLDDLGLIEALQWQAQEFKSRTGIDIKFKSNIKKVKVDKNTSTTLFRIFQEALTNITRHARATKVDVNIEKKEQIFSLKVTDNGVGISSDIGDKSKSFGLLGMKERALILGGKVEVNGADGKGTTVKARIPIK